MNYAALGQRNIPPTPTNEPHLANCSSGSKSITMTPMIVPNPGLANTDLMKNVQSTQNMTLFPNESSVNDHKRNNDASNSTHNIDKINSNR